MFETIVVGVDASGHADQAVQTVAKIAAESKDKVVVFHGVAVHHAKGTVYVIEPRNGAQHLVAVMWHSSPRRASPPPARCTGNWRPGRRGVPEKTR